MPVYALILVTALATPNFDVQTLGGETVSGAIVGLDVEKLVVGSAAGKKEILLKDLLSVRSTLPPQLPPRPAVLVELSDGSRIATTEFQSNQGKAKINLGNDSTVELPVKSLRFVRFLDLNEKSDKLDAQWNELVGSKPVGDLLVVRKKGAIDSTEGVVGNISSDVVAFTLDGDKIDVKRPKVEGIIFAQAAGDEQPEAICTVSDVQGSRWTVQTLKLDNGKLEITTPVGLKTSLTFGLVTQLDFSSGKVLFLSDLEPDSFVYEPYFAPDQPLSALNEFYRLRRDVGLEKNPLKLDGRVYRKGIALHSRSVVAYRLPGKFRFFRATVGIDDAAREGGGNVALEIAGDGKSLWKGSVRGNEAAHALEVDISGVKRLEIVADFGEGQDVADHLDLCDAKVTK